MNVGLLQLLKNNRGNWLTMEAIAGSLESGPSVVLGEIEKLRQIGYLIEAVPAYGFRLSGCGQKFNADLIEHGLGTKRIGRKVLVYESINSTNDVAWQYAMEGGWDGLAVFAEHQRGGRGRCGVESRCRDTRAWEERADDGAVGTEAASRGIEDGSVQR